MRLPTPLSFKCASEFERIRLDKYQKINLGRESSPRLTHDAAEGTSVSPLLDTSLSRLMRRHKEFSDFGDLDHHLVKTFAR